MAELTAGWDPTEIEQIQRQLTCILASSVFAHSHRQSRFLSYIVQATLTGGADRLSQRVIGIEVFDRPDSFDPVVDSIVRVEAARLRSKLREYYDEVGKSDRVYIELPKRTYAVRIRKAPGDAARTCKTQFGVGALEELVVEGTLKSPQGQPTIAVLPFDSMSGDREQECFADGITDDLITDLARLSGLSVIARQSVFAYKGSTAGIQRISEELGAGLILGGSIRRVGNRVRINAQLIDGPSGKHIWAERYDHDMGDIFDLQDYVNRQIVEALRVRLAMEEHARFVHRRDEVRRGEHQRGPRSAEKSVPATMSCRWPARAVLVTLHAIAWQHATTERKSDQVTDG
jgi:adenylate cyclase